MRRLARFAEWSADAGRFVHAAFYWNWRKSRFRRRGACGHAPCQNESDEAKLGPVRCDVVLLWNKPGRFRPLCPLLVRTGDGWRCSVAAKDVRPFWGRALGLAGAALVTFYVVASLGAFALLRWGNDLPIRVTDVAWPGHWHRVRIAQSNRLFAHAISAFQRGRLNEAFLALSSARERFPGNYDAGLFIAQIAMFQGSYSFADGLFAQLGVEEPAHAVRTGIVHHDTLLMLQRYDRLAVLSLDRALADQDRAALWVRSLLFALRRGALAAEFAATHRTEIGRLSPHAQRLLEAEAKLAAGHAPATLGELRRPFSGPLNPTYMEEQVDRLATLGELPTAQALLDAYGPLLGDFRHLLAQFQLDLRAKDQRGAEATFRRLLALATTREQLTFIVTALIDQPDADFYRVLHAHLQSAPALAAEMDGPAMWVAGLICGATTEALEWQQRGYQPGGRYPAIRRVNLASREISDPASPIGLVNHLTFPREVVMALLKKAPAHRAVDALPKWAPPPTRGD
ncbi:MAG: hypothetical protein C0518_14215 [Opitutus sp.]|nr:hypothetical protein [Opitutus sp.]